MEVAPTRLGHVDFNVYSLHGSGQCSTAQQPSNKFKSTIKSEKFIGLLNVGINRTVYKKWGLGCSQPT